MCKSCVGRLFSLKILLGQLFSTILAVLDERNEDFFPLGGGESLTKGEVSFQEAKYGRSRQLTDRPRLLSPDTGCYHWAPTHPSTARAECLHASLKFTVMSASRLSSGTNPVPKSESPKRGEDVSCHWISVLWQASCRVISSKHSTRLWGWHGRWVNRGSKRLRKTQSCL